MNIDFYRILALASAAAAAALLGACSKVDVPKVPGVTPYRMEIQQGNYVSQEMVEQLKPGMTREQVRFILGTPLVTDLFHANRWDFVYFRERANGKREQRSLSVIFEDNKLVRVVGDLMPVDAAKPAASAFPSVRSMEEAPGAAGEKKDERGFFDRLFDKSAPAKAAESKPASQPAPQPPAEAPAPAAESPTGQNWRAASDEPAAKPEAQPESAAAPKEEEKKEAEKKPAMDTTEPGFFGKLREKLGL